MSTNTRQIAIDARVVALNVTANYLIDQDDQPFIERIDDVFLYDRNERTHCCEWTPSYFLIYLYTSIAFRIDDRLDEATEERLKQKYADLPTDDCYVHCHQIDAIEAAAKPFQYYTHGDPGFAESHAEFGDDEAWHDAVMEALREHFTCNCPI